MNNTVVNFASALKARATMGLQGRRLTEADMGPAPDETEEHNTWTIWTIKCGIIRFYGSDDSVDCLAFWDFVFGLDRAVGRGACTAFLTHLLTDEEMKQCLDDWEREAEALENIKALEQQGLDKPVAEKHENDYQWGPSDRPRLAKMIAWMLTEDRDFKALVTAVGRFPLSQTEILACIIATVHEEESVTVDQIVYRCEAYSEHRDA